MTDTPTMVRLADLHPHPGNPRLAPRDDVIDQITSQLNGKLDEAHALIVRPNGAGYQVISGHQRMLAAKKAGLSEVPCWVREMSDEDAYMALALNNAQGELHPLEVGLHALRSDKAPTAYAVQTGQSRRYVETRVYAALVATDTGHDIVVLRDSWSHLAEIHSASKWAWPALVDAMLEKNWTVETTRKQAARFKPTKGGREVPPWIWLEQIAAAILAGKNDPTSAMLDYYDNVKKAIAAGDLDVDRFLKAADDALVDKALIKLSDLQALLHPILEEQQQLIRAKREQELAEAKAKEEQEARIARLREYVSLDEWRELDPSEQQALLAFTSSHGPSFNKQENADIEWAQWSWNPITGCLHDCPYCYARDIANQSRMAKVYPHGFSPTLRPMHLLAPLSQKPPKEAATDARYKNVFTGSMADIFGRWVPEEWINAVLSQMRAAPQWNFLCLTKFPKRMAEFDIPQNTWMGTTVDLQARVAAAEAGFANVNCQVKWLSVEPMLEPLKFTRLDLFDWIVIGGASASTKTPEWHPPIAWVIDLCQQAREAGVAVYMKTNLLHQSTARILELPQGLPVTPDPEKLPSVFNYLGKSSV